MKKLVIFDLDGTLLNTLEDLADCTNYILRQHQFPEHRLDAYRYFVGSGIRNMILRALPEDKRSERLVDQMVDEYIPYYERHKDDKTVPYKGIIPLLKALQSQNVGLAIASNKIQEAMAPLAERYFQGINFAAILGNRSNKPIKPDPAIVFDILEITGIDKEDTLYVGDTAVDMQTAEAAGLEKVGVLWGFRTLEELQNAGADHIIAKPEELLEIIS